MFEGSFIDFMICLLSGIMSIGLMFYVQSLMRHAMDMSGEIKRCLIVCNCWAMLIGMFMILVMIAAIIVVAIRGYGWLYFLNILAMGGVCFCIVDFFWLRRVLKTASLVD